MEKGKFIYSSAPIIGPIIIVPFPSSYQSYSYVPSSSANGLGPSCVLSSFSASDLGPSSYFGSAFPLCYS
ncbi:MAG TPA: hypothetical protein VJ583_04675, partial [Nitrososphaeraceae archaeon]|nr:hypothetical protein [Nitrososphaeraceae archaeon]